MEQISCHYNYRQTQRGEEMKKRKHYHIIGQYWHDSSTTYNYSKGSERDGLSTTAGYYIFCPNCGKKITKKIIKEQESK